MAKNGLTIKIIFFLVLNDFLETYAHFCFKQSALTQNDLHIRSLPDIATFAHSMIVNPHLWIGLVCVGAIFVSWSTILSKIDLSVATPITSFSYVFIALISWLFLHEYISPLRWAGIFFILAGVIFVSMSSNKDADVAP